MLHGKQDEDQGDVERDRDESQEVAEPCAGTSAEHDHDCVAKKSEKTLCVLQAASSFVHTPYLSALMIDRQLKGGMQLSRRPSCSFEFCFHSLSVCIDDRQTIKRRNATVGFRFRKEEHGYKL